MDKPLTFKQKQELHAKKSACLVAIRNNPNPNAESLSRSYGLPVSEVERMIGSLQNGS